MDDFEERNRRMTREMTDDDELQDLARRWFIAASRHEYSYHFTWLGRPIIQFPQDIVAVQEIIWRARPDLIIETGVARGGSLMLSASMMELLGRGQVVGIDIDIRDDNRRAIEQHPLSSRIALIEGSSTDADVVRRVQQAAASSTTVLVLLDSNHTHEHVLRELELYSPLVDIGSYIVVFDTVIEMMPADSFPDRPWGRGNNPATAVRDFLARNDRFVVDRELEAGLVISVAPCGYLKCVRGL